MILEVLSDRKYVATYADRLVSINVDGHLVDMIDVSGNIDIVVGYPLNHRQTIRELDGRNKVVITNSRIELTNAIDANAEFESAKNGVNETVNKAVDLNKRKLLNSISL
jgi:hypothetical protein